MSLRLMFMTDPHLADHGPLGRKDDYRQAILDKLVWLAEECERRKVDHVLCGGDWFHIKRPNHISHQLVGDTIDVLRQFPGPILSVVGNHDQSPDGLYRRHPLSVLEAAGVVWVLDSPLTVKEEGDKSVRGNVLILGRNYNSQRDADPEYYAPTEDELAQIKEGDTVIMVAHGSVLPPESERPYPYVNVHKIPGIEKIDIFLCGHIHENLGTTAFLMDGINKTIEVHGHTVSLLNYFVNPGSLGRTARTQANYARKVQAVIIEIGGEKPSPSIELIDVPAAPAVEVFEAKGVDEKEPVSDGIQQFVTTLGQGLRVEQLTIDELLAGIDGLDQDVGRLVKLYLEESE